MNFATLDLNLLRVLDALLRERSATRAGHRLGLSQPAVSAALNRLRHALDDPLFVRQGNEMAPTRRAEDLARPLRELLTRMEETLRASARFDPAQEVRTFTLLGPDFFTILLMPQLAEEVGREAPGITLRLLDVSRGGVAATLTDGLVDLALERRLETPDWIAADALLDSPFTVVAAADHPDIAARGVAAGAALPLDLFCDLPHVLRSLDGGMTGDVDEALAAIGRRRRVALTVPQFMGVMMAVARGRMIACLPEQLARAMAPGLGLALYRPPLDVPVPRIRIYWHRRHDRDPVHEWLRRKVMGIAAAI